MLNRIAEFLINIGMLQIAQ